MLDNSQWKCERCSADIGNGLIVLYNKNKDLGPIGGRPIESTPDAMPDSESDAARVARDPSVATRPELMRHYTNEALWELNKPINVGMGVSRFQLKFG